MDETAGPVRFEYVLLPLDGSEFSAAALPTARALAARFGAELVLLSVAPHERETESLRQHIAASLNTGGVGPIESSIDVVVADDPARVITGRAAELRSCVVCISTRGRGRVAGAVIGSVAREVLQSCPRPLVAVGPRADRPGSLVGRPRHRPDSWPEPLSGRTIVACVDGSPQSESILPTAVRWATTLGMDLSIVTVAEDVPSAAGGTRQNRFGPSDPDSYVRELVDGLQGGAGHVGGHVLLDPIGVASGLQAHLSSQPASLVALTAGARAGFERVRLGATAADIVRNAPVPALVMRPPTSSEGDEAAG